MAANSYHYAIVATAKDGLSFDIDVSCYENKYCTDFSLSINKLDFVAVIFSYVCLVFHRQNSSK